MSNIVTRQQLEDYKAEGTRTIRMPDGSDREVRMSPDYWRLHDAIKVVEGITEPELAAFALEEVELQKIDFDLAYRSCVAHLAGRWTP